MNTLILIFFLKLVFPGAPRCMHLPSLYNKHIVTFPLFLESGSTALPAISQTSGFLPLSEEQSASGAASGCKERPGSAAAAPGWALSLLWAAAPLFTVLCCS